MKAIVRERKDEWARMSPHFVDEMCRFIGKEIEIEFNQCWEAYTSVEVGYTWVPEWLIFQNGD